MTTREKHIEYSSNVVRTLNPSSPPPLSPASNDFDNKIDYLLEDLQQSVSRPGSSLGYNSASNFSTLNNRDVQYFSSPNSTSKVIRERSISPTSGRRTYKTSKYEYSTSNSGGMANTPKLDTESTINQLDSLLDELKMERDLATEQNNASITSTGYDSGLIEPGHKSRILQSSYTTKSSSSNLRPHVQRELKYDSTNVESETTKTREVSPGYKKIIETTTTKNVNYDPYTPEKLENNIITTINRSTNHSTKNLLPVHETVTVDTIENPLDLSGLPLESDILPSPGTKVTTTVRTYTYEIPADRKTPVNQSVLYNTTSQTNTLRNGTLDRSRPERDVPTNETIIYRNENYNNTTNFLPDGRNPEHDRPVSPRPPTKNVTYIHETYNTTNTVDMPENDQPFPVEPHHMLPNEPPVNKTVIYKRNTRETTNYPGPQRPLSPSGYPGPQRPLSPSGYPRDNNPPESRIVYKENITNTTNNIVHPNGPNYPPPSGHPNGPKTTYYYKHETTNTTNRRYGPPGSGSPRDGDLPPPAILPADPYPREPGNVTYKYTTHTTSRNVNRGPPDETDALMRPAPFPTDANPPYGNGAPPKRLDDLLATFDDSPQKKVYQQQNLIPEKPYTTTVDSLVETANADQKVPTKNQAGPPVYYPPGEMFTKREEGGAAWRAQGGYAKGSGKYMYEAEGKSKSKSSSGAAVVPVCLPLCCAMPCSIM